MGDRPRCGTDLRANRPSAELGRREKDGAGVVESGEASETRTETLRAVGVRVRERVEDRDRLQELYLAHAPRATRFAVAITGDIESARDLVQDAFIRIAGRLRYIRQSDGFAFYLRKTIVSLASNAYRKEQRHREGILRLRSSASTEDLAPSIDTRRDLVRALQRLPYRQRAAIVLRYLEDLSEWETAECLGCSPRAVNALVSRALLALRLETHEGGILDEG
jgi:RNA polymerase sigma factor (sigma-70 family)